MDAFELAALDQAIELALGDAEFMRLGRGDELLAPSEVIDEESLHTDNDGDGLCRPEASCASSRGRSRARSRHAQLR